MLKRFEGAEKSDHIGFTGEKRTALFSKMLSLEVLKYIP